MNAMPEIKLPPSRNMNISMSLEHEELMQQHLRDENLPEAVMPSMPLNKVLKGQKALVTGANSGIGKAVALSLANAGADVVVNYVSRPEAAEDVVKDITKHGGNAFVHKANVAKEDDVQAMFKRMIQEFGTIDILVNNAGLQKDATIDQMSLADWQFVLDVNLTGQFLCSREAIREFKRRGIRKEVSCAAGKIICMSSVSRSHSVGWPCELCCEQGRGDVDDEKHRPGSRTASHPRELGLSRCGPHAHQHGGLGHARSVSRIDEAHSLQTHRRAGRHWPRRRVARQRRFRLHPRREHFRGRR